ncbi:hypothetical protein FN846DRAFT_773720 [Sphaerosporella brunnea]|uniref:T6SS Phospholipase effector Tle1-like catalytic domain-containing protein n=1 Tax=Sphaerosporella brunnea TaxID=1250544 RepID=A0A5J5F5B1_9PEZI|nr:hypothetical protein FN846DRAFT_773720 [Sphaerosporella brunnea]
MESLPAEASGGTPLPAPVPSPGPPSSPQIVVPKGAQLSYSAAPSPAPRQTTGPNQRPRKPSFAGVTHDIRVGQQRKKLVLCFDGTGNKFKGNSGDTNILKIFRMLDRTGGNHVHYYQPGIGTYITNGTLSRVHIGSRMKSWVDKAMDAAVGTSFDQHVMGGYKFIMRFYEPGDDIYMFGFSRGAYTARFLSEMLDHVGLVAPGNEEMVLFAWKTFSNWQQRQDNSKKAALYEYMRAFRETFARPVRRVRFLGLFDTVNSVPRFESAWLKRSSAFPYTARSTARVIRHAVGIDERRAKFRQDLIDKVDIADVTRARTWQTHDKKHKKSKSKRKSKVNVGQNGNAPHHAYGEQLGTAGSGVNSPCESMVSLNILFDNESDSDEDEEAGQDIEEVWFSGCHGDVGGGWDLPDDEEPLSQGPLVWMVHEARKAGVVFDKQRMKEQNCWIDEYEQDDNDSSESLLEQATVSEAPELPHIEVTGASPTEETVEKPNIAPDLHQANAKAHPLQYPLRHLLRRKHEKKVVPKYPPKEFLERSYTRGKIHDCLCFNQGLSTVGVMGWKIMEYLPFRRMDLQPDGSWKAIVWPLPRGEVRDIPENVKIHCSVIKRMQADPTYRPGNLLVGGGGRGVRVAPPEYGTGDWVVIREEGSLVGEVLMKRSAWEKMDKRQREAAMGRANRPMPPAHGHAEKELL